MIDVSNLTKRYAGITAVDHINFQVGKGEIVGFLGPNGAGKSTTMRILSGFLPPTSGSVTIAGFDIFRDSLKARERIGYMPENVPLYGDMRITEYLRYRANLKGVRGRRMKERLSDVIELCELDDAAHQRIATLSKGYRQRVGLADALLNEPDLLLLDEPTIGLDPNQIRHVRNLIRNLGRHHTILLSTHILSEVEMVCSRVIIIHKGKIEASDNPENLRKRLDAETQIEWEIHPPSKDDALRALKTIPGIRYGAIRSTPLAQGWFHFTLPIESTSDPRIALFELATSHQWQMRELSQRKTPLEDVFAELTHSDLSESL